MALIQPLNKTIEVLMAINSGNEIEAASMLGLNCNRQSPSAGSFLEKVCEIAGSSNDTHNGGVLVTPETKSISNKELVADALDLSYAVSESVSILVSNAIAALSTLTEEEELTEPVSDPETGEEVSDAPVIDDAGMNNIKKTMTDGLNITQDALVDVFANTAKLNIKAREMFKKALQENGSSKELYVSLVGNAVTGSGILYAISKISDFSRDNADNVSEALDSSDVLYRADNILFSTLDLQENLIDLYIQMNKFNNNVINLFESVDMPDGGSGSLEDASEFIAMAIEKVAQPIAVNENMLSSDELRNTFDKAFSCVAAIFDEYLQDFCNSNDVANPSNAGDDEMDIDSTDPTNAGDDIDFSKDPTNAGEFDDDTSGAKNFADGI